jgi:hypothetical protein
MVDGSAGIANVGECPPSPVAERCLAVNVASPATVVERPTLELERTSTPCSAIWSR